VQEINIRKSEKKVGTSKRRQVLSAVQKKYYLLVQDLRAPVMLIPPTLSSNFS
jgi:hypothetical protein